MNQIEKLFTDLPGALSILSDTLATAKENFSLIAPILDEESLLRERVKLLELELLTARLKKLGQ